MVPVQAGDAIHPVLRKCKVLTIHGANIDTFALQCFTNQLGVTTIWWKTWEAENYHGLVGREISQRKLAECWTDRIDGCGMPKFHGKKIFMGGCKIMKFIKVFSLESFPLYGISGHSSQYTHRISSNTSPGLISFLTRDPASKRDRNLFMQYHAGSWPHEHIQHPASHLYAYH